MSKRNILLLAVAFLIAATVAFALRAGMGGGEEKVAAVPSSQVLVAVKDIPMGGFVKPGDLAFAPWPKETIQTFHITEATEKAENFNGAVARRALKAGEPVTGSILIKPGAGGFLSAVLSPGMRAVSIEVTATTGTAGFVFPGDYVDLIVTHRVKPQDTSEGGSEDAVVSETFLENVRVVAVDQMLDNPENKAILAKTVTVEVAPAQAERVSVAREMGQISVSLRSLATTESQQQQAAPAAAPVDTGAAGTLEVTPTAEPAAEPSVATTPPGKGNFTRDSDISAVLDHKSNARPRINVIRGGENEVREFQESTQ